MFKTIGKHPQTESLHLRHRFCVCMTVHRDARQFEHSSDPAAVFFLLRFNGKFHGRPSVSS